MRALIGFGTIVLFVGFLWWLCWFFVTHDEPKALPDEETRRMLERAIRQLDRALADPMYRQSTEWEDQAGALVDAYYGKGLKR